MGNLNCRNAWEFMHRKDKEIVTKHDSLFTEEGPLEEEKMEETPTQQDWDVFNVVKEFR